MMEEWRVVPRYPNYEVSSLGEVRGLPRQEVVRRRSGTYVRFRKGKPLRPTLHHLGYLCINTSHDGKAKMVGVHQLVADAFLGECPLGMSVNHINGIKDDNRPENLEYLSNRDNMLHGYRTGLINNRGENNGNSKLSDESVREMLSLKGQKNAVDVAAMFDVKKSYVRDVWSRRSWRHLS